VEDSPFECLIRGGRGCSGRGNSGDSDSRLYNKKTIFNAPGSWGVSQALALVSSFVVLSHVVLLLRAVCARCVFRACVVGGVLFWIHALKVKN